MARAQYSDRIDWVDPDRGRYLRDRIFLFGMVGLFFLILSAYTKAVALTSLMTGEFTQSGAPEVLVALLVPVIPFVLDVVNAGVFSYPWWVWYLVSFSWIASAIVLTSLFVLPRQTFLLVLGAVGSLLFVNLIGSSMGAGILMLLTGYDPFTFFQFYTLLRPGVLAFPVGLFTDLFEFDQIVWLAIIFVWFLQSVGISQTASD